MSVASNHPVASYSDEDEGSLDVGMVLTTQALGVPSVPILTSRSVSPGERGIIAGYGLDNVGGDGVLKAGSMTVARVNKNFIIADFSGMGSNTCSGDSGGPFLVQQAGQYVLGGVTSGGTGDETCQSAGTIDFANLRNPEAIALILGLVPSVVQR